MYRGNTKGTETSKYLQEKKKKLIPKVVASEIGRAQTKCSNTVGVVDYCYVTKDYSRNVLEKHTKEGESLVSEIIDRTCRIQSRAGHVKSCLNQAGGPA